MPLRKSPAASAQMISTRYHEVEIDICPVTGGIWLDRGELMKIIQNTKNDNHMEEFNRFHSHPQTLIEHFNHSGGYNVFVSDRTIDVLA